MFVSGCCNVLRSQLSGFFGPKTSEMKGAKHSAIEKNPHRLDCVLRK